MLYKHPNSIEKGCFVLALKEDLGFGKVVRINSSKVMVEYFHSAANQEHKELPLESLVRVKLPHQTRCYVKHENSNAWQMGRIIQEVDGEYEVDFPDNHTDYFKEADIFTRCNRPIESPLDILIHKGHETPFFNDIRRELLDSLIGQRAAAHGMTGLISSKIHLYAHQVEVVRRVLEDPIQRYLLADEVGLGKTVEAGAILRQYLLDNPAGKVLVLVPPFLMGQWETELEEKFQVGFFNDRVVICETDAVCHIQDTVEYEMVILDEAHHIAAKAFSDVPSDFSVFDAFRKIAHRTSRLLLLSATPVLNNEQDFLAMLHLLDPQFYRLEDIDAFKARISKRQDIGKALMAFREDVRPFQLRRVALRIKEIFLNDVLIQNMVLELEDCFSDSEDDTYKDIVRNIRVHISETHRLHRRMLRNRRDSIDNSFLHGRYSDGGMHRALMPEYNLDMQTEEIHNLLEEWRMVVLGYDIEDQEDILIQIFLMLFRYSDTWLRLLQQIVQMRLTGKHIPGFCEEVGDNLEELCKMPLFSGEREVLDAMRKKLIVPPEEGDRIELPKRVVENILKTSNEDKPPKIVVFTGFTSCAHQILHRLRHHLGPAAIASHTVTNSQEEIEQGLLLFRTKSDCQVLVCDRSGEEGRNLQHADLIVHFDLPWSPNQLEQRIGRLDRIGRKKPLRSRVFLGAELEDPVSMHEAWFEVLNSGFKIFHKSIAGLQFYVDDKIRELGRLFFREGTTALLDNIEKIKQEIEEEHLRIKEQNVLDEIDALKKNAATYFKGLTSVDAKSREIQAVSEEWICKALNFDKEEKRQNQNVLVQYQPTRRTIVPLDVLCTRSKEAKKKDEELSKGAWQQKIHMYLSTLIQFAINGSR